MESIEPPKLEALIEKLTERIAALEAAVRNGQATNGDTELDVVLPEVLISEAIEKWLLHNQRFTPQTRSTYFLVIRQFIESLPKKFRYVNEVDVPCIQSYLNGLFSKGLTNRTANSYLTAVKSFFRWVSGNYGLDNPASKLKMLKPEPPQQRYLIPEEYDSILAACKNRKAKDLLITLANTGLRATEIEQLTWDNINEEMTLITFTGKGRKRRVVPINSVVRECLLRYPHKSETRIQFSKSRRAQYKLMCRLCQKVGIKRAGPHSLRHYCATELLKAGVSLTKVSHILGHHSTGFTEKQYCHISAQSFLKGATECLCKEQVGLV